MNNKLPYFLVALCLCMFCTFTAYADDAPPAEDSTQTAAEEETHDVVQVQGVQMYDPQLYEQLYEKLNTLQESVNALVDALKPDETTEDAEPTPEPDTQDYTAQLSDISGQLVDLRTAVELATPETAELGILDKSFNDYTPLEGYALLTFVVVLAACFIVIFRRY